MRLLKTFLIFSLYCTASFSNAEVASNTFYFETSAEHEIRVDVIGPTHHPLFIFYNDTDEPATEVFKQFVTASLEKQTNHRLDDEEEAEPPSTVMDIDLKGITKDTSRFYFVSMENSTPTKMCRLRDTHCETLDDVIFTQNENGWTVIYLEPTSFTVFTKNDKPVAMCLFSFGQCTKIEDVVFTQQEGGWAVSYLAAASAPTLEEELRRNLISRAIFRFKNGLKHTSTCTVDYTKKQDNDWTVNQTCLADA